MSDDYFSTHFVMPNAYIELHGVFKNIEHLILEDCIFRGLVFYHHDGMWAEMVLNKKMWFLCLDLQATESILPQWAWLEHIWVSKSESTVTLVLQWDHTYSKKATPSNCVTPFGVHFLSNYYSTPWTTKGLQSYHNAKMCSVQLQKAPSSITV